MSDTEQHTVIYLHMDNLYRPDKWYRRFAQQLAQRNIAFRKVNLLKQDYRDLPIESNDGLIGRFGHHARDLRRMRPIYADLDDRFDGRVFPKYHTYSYYDDKRRQMELLRAKGYPAPQTAFVETLDDVERFLSETKVGFPLVAKKTYGAASTNVRLVHHCDKVFLPGIVQEFCPRNESDLRVVVIGNRVMGFQRNNRPNDFRASGSGRITHLAELDPECVRLAHRISSENGFESMAYDFVRDAKGRWVVLELSYAYVDFVVRDCRYYYDMPSGEKKDKTGVYPQDFILQDFLMNCPQIKAEGKRRWKMRSDFSSLLARLRGAADRLVP